MTAPGSSVRSYLLLGLGYLFGSLAGLSGQTAPSSSAAAQQADQELNKAYQEVRQKLAPKSRTQLRDAQRAWLVFVEQDSAAAHAAAVKLGKTNQDCEDFEVDKFEHRTGELNDLPDSGHSEVFTWMEGTKKNEREMSKSEVEALLPRLDAELNVVYQRCLHLLPDEEGARLRDAQRAWLAFRDASKPFGVNGVYLIITHRIKELSGFYVGSDFESQLSKQISSELKEEMEQKGAGKTVPDPFEHAR